MNEKKFRQKSFKIRDHKVGENKTRLLVRQDAPTAPTIWLNR